MREGGAYYPRGKGEKGKAITRFRKKIAMRSKISLNNSRSEYILHNYDRHFCQFSQLVNNKKLGKIKMCLQTFYVYVTKLNSHLLCPAGG